MMNKSRGDGRSGEDGVENKRHPWEERKGEKDKILTEYSVGFNWWNLSDFDEEKSEEAKPVTLWAALGRMWTLIGDEQWIVYLGLGGLIVAAVSEISMPSILAASIFSADSRATAEFHRNARLLIMLCITSGICSGLRSCCFAIANTVLVKRFRETLYLALVFQDMSFFDTETVGGLTSRLGADCQHLSKVIGNDVHLILRNIVQGTGALINLLKLSWPLTSPTLVICFALSTIVSVYGQYQKKAAKLTQEFNASANNTVQETLSMIRTVQVYGAEEEELRRYKKWLDKLAFVSIRESVAYGFWNMSFHTLYRLTQVQIILST
ncbi:hypothetical protein SLEP1_g10118 [Rubroshorea leprosula]|uniref:ABC transmembrane type-1 domain-containing protein n=1 Tax=Rubroshorea leprosula TaxID=152421 RepID=A0AAV5I735_9ROSI|nr:hypothetical protein SLEP1_g10118 [Rubroshorea leprosula]